MNQDDESTTSAITKIEADSLKGLFEKLRKDTQTVFGEKYRIGTQGMVWQYLNGRRPLNHAAAAAFAEGLNVSIDEFSPRLADEIRAMTLRVAPADGEIRDDQATLHGLQVLRAMQPAARYQAVQILDTLAKPAIDPPPDGKRSAA